MSATVTDGGWFSEFHIPAIIYGPGTLEEAHSVNEKVEIEQLIEFTKVITAFIYEWCHEKIDLYSKIVRVCILVRFLVNYFRGENKQLK